MIVSWVFIISNPDSLSYTSRITGKMSEKLENTGQNSQKGGENFPERKEKEENPTISNVEYPSTTASSFSSEDDNVYTRKEHAPIPAFNKKKKSVYYGLEVSYYRNLAKHCFSMKLISLLSLVCET